MTGDLGADSAVEALAHAVCEAAKKDRTTMLGAVLDALDQYHRDVRALRRLKGLERAARIAEIRRRFPMPVITVEDFRVAHNRRILKGA